MTHHQCSFLPCCAVHTGTLLHCRPVPAPLLSLKGDGGEDGIIPLAVREVFDRIGACQDREFLVRVSYMEASHLFIFGRVVTDAEKQGRWSS